MGPERRSDVSKVTRGSGQRRHESWPLHAPTFSPRALVHVSRLCRHERRVSGGPQEPPPQGEMRVEKLQCSCVPGLWAARGGQLLLPELPAPTPTHPAGAEAAGPQGSFQTPKPVRWSRPVSPTGNWAEEKWKLVGSGRRDHPVGLFHPVTRVINDPLPKARMNKSPRCLGPASAGGQVFQVPAPRPCGKLWPAHEGRKSGPRPSPGGACTHLLG